MPTKREYQKIIKTNTFKNDQHVKSMSDVFTPNEIISYYPKFDKSIYNYTKSKFYNCSILDSNGIDYNNWFKLHYDIGDVIQKISYDPFKLLLTMICHPHTRRKELLHTSLKDLMIRLNISDTRQIKAHMQRLIINKYIFIKDYHDQIKQNDMIDILILYNNNLIAFESKGFKPIPIDYFNNCLLHLTGIQCAIVCILIDKFTYFVSKEIYNSETKQKEYVFQECEYAFPSLDTLGIWLGYDRHVIKNNIVLLAEQNIISYGVYGNKSEYGVKDGEDTIINPNYTYRVKLLQRMEYQYFYYYNFTHYDSRTQEEILYVRSNMRSLLYSSEYKRFKQYDYPCVKYNFTDFDKAIRNENMNYYSKNKSSLLIDNFYNEDLKHDIPQNNEQEEQAINSNQKDLNVEDIKTTFDPYASGIFDSPEEYVEYEYC